MIKIIIAYFSTRAQPQTEFSNNSCYFKRKFYLILLLYLFLPLPSSAPALLALFRPCLADIHACPDMYPREVTLDVSFLQEEILYIKNYRGMQRKKA
jgi:hypothetical protein